MALPCLFDADNNTGCPASPMVTDAAGLTAVIDATAGMIIVSAAKTTYEHKGLGDEETWRYRVYAYNDMASDNATNIATAKTLKAAASGAPRNLRAVRDSATGVNLYWNWPAGDTATPTSGGFMVQSRVTDGKLEPENGVWRRPPVVAV